MVKRWTQTKSGYGKFYYARNQEKIKGGKMFITTDGKEYPEPVIYTCCRVTTDGQHEWNCPCNPVRIKDLKKEESDG